MSDFFICSDLHTEFLQPFEHKLLFDKFPDTEGIIIAGDLSTKKYLVDNLKYLCDKYKHVVFVTGNHEYYGNSFDGIEKTLELLEHQCSNLYWFSNRVAKINDITFFGSTLWFRDEPLNQLYERSMNDFFHIRDFRKEVYKRNETSLIYLETFLNSSFANSVVVTHHLPSYQSVNDKYKGDPLNRFFVCDMENLILEKQPKFFIHGHSHDSCDYMIGSTRVLCNPRGYSHELNKKFRYDLIIDI